MKGGPFAINFMRFPNIRLVEQTGQKFSSHSSLSQKEILLKKQAGNGPSRRHI